MLLKRLYLKKMLDEAIKPVHHGKKFYIRFGNAKIKKMN